MLPRRSRHASRLESRTVTILLASVLCACRATSNPSAIELVPVPTALVFENATIDAITLYVDDGRSQLLLGYVEPGRTARLKLPDDVRTKPMDVVLVAVPLGSHRDGGRPSDAVGAIRSELESTRQLASLRWTLTGRQLVGSVQPAARRSPERLVR